jgi:hypothetical protein
MALDYKNILNRMVAIEKEAMLALSTPVTADAWPRFYVASESFPYFTNRVGPWRLDDDSEDIDIIEQDFIARLVIGHLTSGYQGERDAELATWITHLLEYFSEREWLQSAAYPAVPNHLTSARLVNGPGYTVYVNSAIGSSIQIGTELTIRCTFDHDITQAYA